MANIKISRKELEKQIKLTPEIINKISMLGTPLESINDDEIELEIFPNRPDLLSFQGFIRAFKSFLGKETGLKKFEIQKPLKNYEVEINPNVQNIRPFTVCAIVKNLKFTDERIKEIVDLQEKLHNTVGRNRKKLAIGIYPLEKIKLPIKFEARKPRDIKFLPLEAEREMNALEILQRHPTGRDYAHLLEGKEIYPVFVDGNGKILSLPPIINSHETGKVTEATTEIFIECSGFDLNILNKTLNIIVANLIDQGGQAYAMNLKYKKTITTPDFSSEKITLSTENVNKLLGLQLKESEIKKLIERMGYNYNKGIVEVPAYRTDIFHEVDLIEDVAISYGYENFIPEIPDVATTGKESNESKIERIISNILTGLQLVEISSYHLIKEAEAKSFKLEENEKIEIIDSKTEYKMLRPNLLIPCLRILVENKDNEYPQKIFEVGTVFSKSHHTETGIEEEQNLLIASTPGNFTEIKQILDYLFKNLDLNYSMERTVLKNLIDGRTGKIVFENEPIGYIGEIHPDTLRKWNIKMPVSVMELSLKKLIKTLS